MLAKISWFCSLLAVGLLVCGGLCLVWSDDSRQDGDALIVEDREQDLGEQTLGTHTLELHVRNNSSQPHRVLGMTGQ
jgi:hypothetical protein